jgi:hypothetical protein
MTSAMGRAALRMSEGLVVTPSRSPVSASSRISATSAVSTKNFMDGSGKEAALRRGWVRASLLLI